MYLLVVNYTQPTEEASKHTETHTVWVKKYIEQGVFLFAGPKKSKSGGAILVKSMDKSLLKKILAEDSFVQADVAEYQIIDFDIKLVAENFKSLIGA